LLAVKGDPSRLADFKKRDANHDGVVTKKKQSLMAASMALRIKSCVRRTRITTASSIGQKCRPTTRAGKVPPLNLINLATWD